MRTHIRSLIFCLSMVLGTSLCWAGKKQDKQPEPPTAEQQVAEAIAEKVFY